VSGAVAPVLAVDARKAARAAAERSGVEVAELHDIRELGEAAELFVEVWRTPAGEAPATPALLRALAHSGNYVSGARREGRMVGASVGFLHPHHGGIGLHSHITGVREAAQGGSIGFALKQHQRAFALDRDVEAISWTFDPLVRRNAFFNLVKLGAEIVEYLPDFYGPMADAINAGDESDRCLVSWPLTGERAVAASHGAGAEPDVEELRERGARVLLGIAREAGSGGESAAPGAMDLAPLRSGAPAPGALAPGAPLPGGAPASGPLLVGVPEDVVAIRASDRELASRWRRAVRATMGEALSRGFAATGITRSGWYVLERSRQESR
jgi:predicted GNAT superfamily acetyltransferase